MFKTCRTIFSKYPLISIVHNQFITMSDHQTPICHFAFIDLETTGLPSLENNRSRITELSISVVESNHIRMGVFPRVQNKLNLCFNPCKFISPDSTTITGLSNDLLEHQPSFSLDIVKTINEFLSLYKSPICFVAHNGNLFDYPILRAEINKAQGELSEDILCIDSLLCFRDLYEEQQLSQVPPVVESTSCLKDLQGELHLSQSTTNSIDPADNPKDETDCPPPKKAKSQGIPLEFTDDFDQFLCDALDDYEESIKRFNIQKKNETTPVKPIKSRKILRLDPTRKYSTVPQKPRVSFKLEDIYRRLTSESPAISHNAEADVQCLIQCAAKYGEDFVKWANNNAKRFAEIPAMKPGTKIGF